MKRYNCNYTKFKYFRGIKNPDTYYSTEQNQKLIQVLYGNSNMNNSIYNFVTNSKSSTNTCTTTFPPELIPFKDLQQVQEMYSLSCQYNEDLIVANTFGQSMGNTPLLELVYFTDETETTSYVYISYFIKNQLSTQMPDDLIINDDNIFLNTYRVFLMDNAIALNFIEPTEEYPNFKYFPFKNNTNISVTFQNLAIVNTTGTDPYQETSTIERITTWIWYPTSFIYLLVCPYPYKIYVMQNYSSDMLSYGELVYLSPRLVNLPPDWIYTYLNLEKNTYLFVTADRDAIVIKDDFGNSYQYIKEKDAQWLYDKYRF